MPVNVFVSHQWHDKLRVEQIVDALEQIVDVNVWLDYRNLRLGDRIGQTIEDVLAETDVVLVIWSPHSAESGGVADEIDAATRLGLPLVPCFISYADDGAVDPPLPDTLGGLLGVDLFHDLGGIATLGVRIVELHADKHGVSAPDSPLWRMGQNLRATVGYMANYRDRVGVDDDRSAWIGRTLDHLEQYVAETGDTEHIAVVAAGLEMIRDSDPDAYAIAMPRVRSLLEADSPASAPPAAPAAAPDMTGPRTSTWSRSHVTADLLDQALAAAGVRGATDGHRAALSGYVATAATSLHQLTDAVQRVRSPAGMQVVHYLTAYLAQADDLVPDHHEIIGLLDDAWLILNTAFRLIESGALTVQQVPIVWQQVIAVDPLVRAVLPAPALAALEQHMIRLLQLIAAEIASYDPWMTPTASGYAPVIASGGAWEDQMHAMLTQIGMTM